MLNDWGKELIKPWVSVQNAALVGTVIFVIALFKPSSEQLAAWVQAVGSVAAILAAIRIASGQRREQLFNEAQRKETQRQTINVLTERARRGVVFVPNSELSLMSSLAIVTGLRKSFESIALLDLPDPKLVEPISTIRDSLRALEVGLSESSKTGSLMRYVVTQECCLWVALIITASKKISPIIYEPEM